MKTNKDEIFISLKKTLDSYYPLEDKTWEEYKKICTFKEVKKNEFAFDLYDEVNSITFIYKGLLRSFTINENGDEYNKNFFWETRFFGPMTALLKNMPINSSVKAIEDSILVNINFKEYRKLLYKYDDLKLNHILYLEEHWIIEKDSIPVSLVLHDAKERYEYFQEKYSHIIKRIPLREVASFLGISSTHLSRIRKDLEN